MVNYSNIMKVVDIIFALICGRVVAWVASDFLKGYGIEIGNYKYLLYYALPALSLLCLWLAFLIGKKFIFVFQAAKFFLVGVFATVVDLKIFELTSWLFGMVIFINPLYPKAISFIIATFAKFWGNKYWAFAQHSSEQIQREILQFIMVTLIGLALDVSAFFYLNSIVGPKFGTPEDIWTKLCVILAALVSAVWSFSGYKFIVFKK